MISELSVIKRTELLVLQEVVSLFDKYNIPYFLACGTLLGSVRHHGFIPWDDDIDVYCFGSDYKKIVDAFSQYKGNIKFCDAINSPNYPYWFPKAIYKNSFLVEKELKNNQFKNGVYIDIFLLMNLPDNRVKAFFLEKKRYFYYGLIKAFYQESTSFLLRIIGFISRLLIDPTKVYKRLVSLYSGVYNGKKYLIDTGVFGRQAYLDKNSFSDYKLGTFENHHFHIPKGYDIYLRNYYGDYLVLPPEERRVSGHHYIYIEIDKKIIWDER